MPRPIGMDMPSIDSPGEILLGDDRLGLRTAEAEDVGGRYRATFKHRFNEAEPPRAVEFVASGPSAAQCEAQHRSRPSEVVVDIVLIS